MVWSHLLLGFLWILYCFLHSLLASLSIKKKMQQLMGASFKYYRLYYTLFAFAGLIALLFYQWRLTNISLFTSALLYYAGWVLTVSGAVLMLICIKKYFLSLSGVRSLVEEKPSSSLEVQGIHRYVRHPLYLGTFAFLWGIFLINPLLSWLIVNSIITGYTVYAIKLEEKKLVAEFGDSYLDYQSRVPALWPRLTVKENTHSTNVRIP